MIVRQVQLNQPVTKDRWARSSNVHQIGPRLALGTAPYILVFHTHTDHSLSLRARIILIVKTWALAKGHKQWPDMVFSIA